MAVKLPSFKLLPAVGAKFRVLLVVFSVLAVLVAAYFAMSYFGGEGGGGTAQVAAAPSGLKSVPGGKSSPEYYRAVVAANEEASRQARITGASAVPTLLNVPSSEPSYKRPQQNCKILCPDHTKIDIKSDLDQLVKSGKLSRKDANKLIDLAARNVPVDESAAALDELVRQGELTPEQARNLLEKYRQQHRNGLIDDSSKFMDSLIGAGQLSLDEANRLLALQKSGISPAMYAAGLKREVKDGRLSADTASQLLGHYTAQQVKEGIAQGAYELKKLVKQGAMTAAVSDALAGLQSSSVPVSQYKAKLDELVSQGKLTPLTAKSLLKSYKGQRARNGSADALTDLIRRAKVFASNCVLEKIGEGGFERDDASQLVGLQDQGVTMTVWQNTIASLQKNGKCTPEVGKKLILCYQKLASLRSVNQRLRNLQSENASQVAYANALKQAVQTGLINPQDAADLMQEYSSMVTPVTSIASSVETSLPGAEDFAKLQRRIRRKTVRSGKSTDTPVARFSKVVVSQQAQQSSARAEQIEALKTAMMSQAQSLLTSWQQPATMQHVAGSMADDENSTESTRSQKGSRLSTSSGGLTTGQTQSAPALPPLIKGGTILFAVLDTAVNSDYPDTPVMATIVQGKLKGSKLIGKLYLASGQDKLSLSFNSIDVDSWVTSKSINAFAIDPETARTVMATSVDHHYLLRYGSLMATSFLTGYASAISSAGESTTGIFGTSTTTPELSPGNRLAVALGEVGTQLSNATQKLIDTPATVKIKSGVAIGIMFTADVAAS